MYRPHMSAHANGSAKANRGIAAALFCAGTLLAASAVIAIFTSLFGS